MGDPPDSDSADPGTTNAPGSGVTTDTPAAAPADDSTAEGAPDAGAGPGATGSVTRSATGTTTPSTLVLDVVDLFFQVYPGTTTPDGTNVGIANVAYTVQIGTNPVQSFMTNADGRARISIPVGSSATVRIFDTDYIVTARATLEAVTTLAGQQRRLQMLGYDLGPNGVDGQRGRHTEKAILDFQADADLPINGRAHRSTRDRLQEPGWAGE